MWFTEQNRSNLSFSTHCDTDFNVTPLKTWEVVCDADLFPKI